jgi:enoyl-CoA hydratase/carnithine racemase
MAEESPVLTELQGDIGVVTLNRPGKFNCVSRGLADSLSAAMRSLDANAQCRVVMLKANGKHFCTGADLDEVLAARETRASPQDTTRSLLSRTRACQS